MNSNAELTKLFFSELKKYNTTNFKTLEKCDVESNSPEVMKAFSSVVTRFFIFLEKHPEVSESSAHLLYYKLKIDMISRYFSSYPDCNPSELKPFQTELIKYSESLQEVFHSNES